MVGEQSPALRERRAPGDAKRKKWTQHQGHTVQVLRAIESRAEGLGVTGSGPPEVSHVWEPRPRQREQQAQQKQGQVGISKEQHHSLDETSQTEA